MGAGLELTQPHWLWLLPLLAVALLAARPSEVDSDDIPGLGNRLRDRYLHPLLQKVSAPLTRPRARGVRDAWRWVVLALLVLALTGPVRIGERLPDPPRQRDIVFVVDTSISMILRDYLMDEQRVSRLTVLKGVLGRFVDGLQGERLGLIAYAERAYPVVPLTRDHDLLRAMVARLDTGVAGRTNAIGEALAMTAELGGDGAAPRRRILILFSGAGTPTGSITPETAAALVAAKGWRLYTVAIGAASAEAEEQRITGLIYRPADLQRLQGLATATGGRFFQAGDTAALSDAIAAIDAEAMPEITVEPRYVREPLYQWPLLAALALLSAVQMRRLLGPTT